MKTTDKFTSDSPSAEMHCRFSKGASNNKGRYLFTRGMIPWKTKVLKDEIIEVKNCPRHTTCIRQPLSREKFSQKTSDAIQQEMHGVEWTMITAFIVGYLVSNCVVRFDLWSSDLEREYHWPPFGVQVGGDERRKSLPV